MTEPASEYLPFARPSIGDAELAAAVEVLKSGWITTGKRCAELEARFCELTGAPHSVAVTSGTAAMHLTLMALGIGPGDEVITPSMTWVSTVNLITLLGATPVFVDVDRETLMVTRELVEPAITDRTRAIVPVHFAGAPLDLAPLRALSSESGITLLEDAAHAIGTGYRGDPVGAAGTAIFSLHPIKNVTSIEGGVLCTQDGALAERVRRLRFHGLGQGPQGFARKPGIPQNEVLEPGYKYNLPDVNAAIGLAQLERLDTFVARRTALATLFRNGLAELEAIQPLGLPSAESRHAWHLFIVRVHPEHAGCTRDELRNALDERGIGTGLHFRAVHEHPYYRTQRFPGQDTLPNSEWNSERIVSLPLFPDMLDEDVTRVLQCLQEVLG